MELTKQVNEEYVVARVSQGYNSFGLRGHILMNREGKAYQLLLSYYNEKKQGERVQARVRTYDNGQEVTDFPTLDGECLEYYGQAPANIAAEAFGEQVEVTVKEPGKKKVTRAPKLSDSVAVSRASKRRGVVTEDELRSSWKRK